MTISLAARELEGIRNNRHSPAEELAERVDVIGRWAASQKRCTKSIMNILAEASDLHARLTGGPRHGKTTIIISG
jgi:hypothetical protein